MAKSRGIKNAPSTTGNPSGKGRSNNTQRTSSGNQKSSSSSSKGNSKK